MHVSWAAGLVERRIREMLGLSHAVGFDQQRHAAGQGGSHGRGAGIGDVFCSLLTDDHEVHESEAASHRLEELPSRVWGP